MAPKKQRTPTHITARRRVKQAGQVAADSLKASLADRIDATIIRDQLTQTQAAHLMGVAPSEVSLIMTGKLAGFSLERLALMLTALGYNVTVTTKRVATPRDEGGDGSFSVYRGTLTHVAHNPV